MDMEGNRNQNISTTTLCRAGCGFYGNQAFDGMCSKCYKDAVKRKQNAPVTGGRGTPSQADCGSSSSSIVEDVTAVMTPQTTPSVETATPTVAIPVATPSNMEDTSSTTADKSEESGAGGAASTSSGMEGSPGGSEEKKSKKNRCSTCKKKVGLTGFECRCGGLYCSLHRYSDKHDCQFDYKEMAQEQIRRNNPVVVGAKIQKL